MDKHSESLSPLSQLLALCYGFVQGTARAIKFSKKPKHFSKSDAEKRNAMF